MIDVYMLSANLVRCMTRRYWFGGGWRALLSAIFVHVCIKHGGNAIVQGKNIPGPVLFFVGVIGQPARGVEECRVDVCKFFLCARGSGMDGGLCCFCGVELHNFQWWPVVELSVKRRAELSGNGGVSRVMLISFDCLF